MLTVHNFSYGLLTPALGYLMSFLGAFLGLRCTTRSRASTGAARIRWLLVAAVAIGITGIWVMHFIAMLGFTIPGQTILYNVPITLGSMVIAVIFVFIGLLSVGLGKAAKRSLIISGVITGLGVAAMHYTGMAAMEMRARITYNPELVAISILIAIVAATAALWAAVRLRGVLSTLGAAAIMGVAVSGMHYTGMAAMHLWPAPGGMVMNGASAEAFLLPLIVGVSVITFVLIATIALSPTEEELNAEAELMRRIETAGSAAPAAVMPPVPSTRRDGQVWPT
jgi:NO-binding membrane sensor protein with MHYT domain